MLSWTKTRREQEEHEEHEEHKEHEEHEEREKQQEKEEQEEAGMLYWNSGGRNSTNTPLLKRGVERRINRGCVERLVC